MYIYIEYYNIGCISRVADRPKSREHTIQRNLKILRNQSDSM